MLFLTEHTLHFGFTVEQDTNTTLTCRRDVFPALIDNIFKNDADDGQSSVTDKL